VWATTRSPDKAERLRETGAEPVVVDVFDAEALANAVLETRPDIVIHRLTDLADPRDPVKRSAALARNARLRDEGTRNWVAGRRARLTRAASSPKASPGSMRPALGPFGRRLCSRWRPTARWELSTRGVESLERQILAGSTAKGRLCGPGTGTDAPPPARAAHVDARPTLPWVR
jgi:hypothetical protein